MLQWDFKKDYLGYYEEKDALLIDGKPALAHISLYSGNGLFIAIFEYGKQEHYNEEEKEKYQLYSFASDIEHFKNTLGISKSKYCIDKSNLYENVVKWHFERTGNNEKNIQAINKIIKELIKTSCYIEIK